MAQVKLHLLILPLHRSDSFIGPEEVFSVFSKACLKTAGSKVVLGGGAQPAVRATEAAALLCDRQRQGSHQGAGQLDTPLHHQ